MNNNGGHLTIQYNLRWSEELKNKIAESAKAHNRSMNADIVARLEKSFEDEQSKNENLEESIKDFFKKIMIEQENNLKTSLADIIKNQQNTQNK